MTYPSMSRIVAIAATLSLALTAAGVGLWFWSDGALDTSSLLDRDTFRCLSASESMRTIGYARHTRKAAQIKRIDRLLGHDLEALDAAKLRSERAILAWEGEDARFLRDCAEAYYTPGGTGLRETFGDPPAAMDYGPTQASFEAALAEVPERLRPHGFEERAALHLAEAALARGDAKAAIEQARKHLKEDPQGLYTDTIQLVLADALLIEGDLPGATAMYQEVGRMRIGQDAQYARYRLSMLLRAQGDEAEAEVLYEDVLEWAERGGRVPVERALQPGDAPMPPLPIPRPAP